MPTDQEYIATLEDRVLLLEHAVALLIVRTQDVYPGDATRVLLDVNNGNSAFHVLGSLVRDLEIVARGDR